MIDHILAFLRSMDEPEMAEEVLAMHNRLEAFASGLDRDAANAKRDAFAAIARERDVLRDALKTIRYAARNDHPTAVWMQKMAAHALEPDKWPRPPSIPPRPNEDA